MALSKEEILKLIKKEEEKIKEAQERKESYQFVSNGGSSIYQIDEQKEEALANKPAQKELGKVFYIAAITAGLLIIALIVIVILGIISNWDFKF